MSSPPISFLCTNFPSSKVQCIPIKSSPSVQTKWWPPGPPGTGKSTMASLISERENRVFYEGISWQRVKRKHWKVRKVTDFSSASTPTYHRVRIRQVHDGGNDLDERWHQDVCNNQTFGFINCMWGEMSKWEASADWTWYEGAPERDVWLLWVRFCPLAGSSTHIQGDFFNSSCTAEQIANMYLVVQEKNHSVWSEERKKRYTVIRVLCHRLFSEGVKIDLEPLQCLNLSVSQWLWTARKLWGTGEAKRANLSTIQAKTGAWLLWWWWWWWHKSDNPTQWSQIEICWTGS